MSRVVQPSERPTLLEPEFLHRRGRGRDRGRRRAQLRRCALSPLGRDAAPRHARSRSWTTCSCTSTRCRWRRRWRSGSRSWTTTSSRSARALPDSRRVWRLGARSCSSAPAAGSSRTRSSTSRSAASSTRRSALAAGAARGAGGRDAARRPGTRSAGSIAAGPVLDLVERAELEEKKASQRLFSPLALERWMLMFVDGEQSLKPSTPAPDEIPARLAA